MPQNTIEQIRKIIQTPGINDKDILQQLKKLLYENNNAHANTTELEPAAINEPSDSLIETINYFFETSKMDEVLVLKKLKELYYKATQKELAASETLCFSELVTNYIEELNKKETFVEKINTRFNELDRLIDGFGIGELVVVGGLPNIGKTHFLTNMASKVSDVTPTLYCSLDCSKEEISSRIYSSMTGYPYMQLLEQNLSNVEQFEIINALDNLKNHKLYIHNTSGENFENLMGICEMEILSKNIKLIIIDNLQLLRSSKEVNNTSYEISYICSELKSLAVNLNVCVVAASEFSNNCINDLKLRVPELTDLGYNGSIAAHADKVLLINRPSYFNILLDEELNEVDLITEVFVAKNTAGKLGLVRLLRDDKFTRLYEFTGFKCFFDITHGSTPF